MSEKDTIDIYVERGALTLDEAKERRSPGALARRACSICGESFPHSCAGATPSDRVTVPAGPAPDEPASAPGATELARARDAVDALSERYFDLCRLIDWNGWQSAGEVATNFKRGFEAVEAATAGLEEFAEAAGAGDPLCVSRLFRAGRLTINQARARLGLTRCR